MTDTAIRAALKKKWHNDDLEVNVKAMAKWSGWSEESLRSYIEQLNKELISTVFILK